MRELMNKPEVQAMITLQQKAAIEARYAALFKNLNLPAEQIEKLKTLLADRSNTIVDVMSAAREQGINPRENPEAFRKLVADAQNQVDMAIKSVIGDQGFAQLATYEQTLPQRNVVNELQQRLSYTSVPLTPAQAEQMVQILANNAPQRPAGTSRTRDGAGGPRSPVTFSSRGSDLGGMVAGAFGASAGMMSGIHGGSRGTAPVTDAAVSQAQTVLAPPQVDALHQIQQQQQTQQQLRQLVGDTLNANRPAPSKRSSGTVNSSGPSPSGPTPTTRRRGGGGE
jgi:hypothetical protein